MLTLLKLYLNITTSDKDTLLNQIITDCISSFEQITSNVFDSTNTDMQSICVQMSICVYNRLGTQGLAGQSYSGMSENYIDGFPRDLYQRIIKYKKLRTA